MAAGMTLGQDFLREGPYSAGKMPAEYEASKDARCSVRQPPILP
jgi:hypothetical protein